MKKYCTPTRDAFRYVYRMHKNKKPELIAVYPCPFVEYKLCHCRTPKDMMRCYKDFIFHK